MSTLTASLTKTSGGKIPVDSTETEREEQNISQQLHPNVVGRSITVVQPFMLQIRTYEMVPHSSKFDQAL